eukprot:6443754-Prymnesium_polylepis.1
MGCVSRKVCVSLCLPCVKRLCTGDGGSAECRLPPRGARDGDGEKCSCAERTGMARLNRTEICVASRNVLWNGTPHLKLTEPIVELKASQVGSSVETFPSQDGETSSPIGHLESISGRLKTSNASQ